MALTAEFILQGYAYALEQCGVLLRDACRLYKEGSHAGAIVLTEYSIRIDEWYFAPGSSSNEVLEQSDPDLFTALDQWRERPKLLPAPDVGSAPTKTAAA